MADKYLLNCECGNRHSVGTHQAGAELKCECGQTLQVPRLGELRQLPRDEGVTSAAETTTRWEGGHSLVMAGFILGLLALGVGLWAHFSMPSVSQFRDDVGEWSKWQLDEWLAQASPKSLYQVWHQELEQLTSDGFTMMDSAGEKQVMAGEAQQEILRNTSFVLATLCFGLAIVGYFLTWRRR